MIAVIDNGGANIASLLAAFGRLGCEAHVTREAAAIAAASHVVLPGVGAAADGMTRLESAGLADLIPRLRQPLLGICLGMQLLYESSEEGPSRGLGLLPGVVTRLWPSSGSRSVHTGWSRVRWGTAHPLAAGLDGRDSWFYFNHGYAVAESADAVGVAAAGAPFTAAAAQGRVMGVQFHPERSGAAGARLLKNFVEMH